MQLFILKLETALKNEDFSASESLVSRNITVGPITLAIYHKFKVTKNVYLILRLISLGGKFPV